MSVFLEATYDEQRSTARIKSAQVSFDNPDFRALPEVFIQFLVYKSRKEMVEAIAKIHQSREFDEADAHFMGFERISITSPYILFFHEKKTSISIVAHEINHLAIDVFAIKGKSLGGAIDNETHETMADLIEAVTRTFWDWYGGGKKKVTALV